MMLEFNNVTIGQRIRSLSAMVDDGQLLCVLGAQGTGKTTLLRAVLGFVPVDEGFICIDGELLTPLSAPYFRRQMAYVPQHLSVPEGYDGAGLTRWPDLSADERYLLLLTTAIRRSAPLLVVDEPPQPLKTETETLVDNLLRDAAQHGTTVLAVNPRITSNQIQL